MQRVGEAKPIVRPDPVLVLRVTVKAPDLDGFIQRYSRHIAGDRIFIFSKNPQPVGTPVRFTLQLATGDPLIAGRGTVRRMQLDTGDTHRPPGMEVQFVPLDEQSQTLVEFMRATREGEAKEVAVAPVARALASKPGPKPITFPSTGPSGPIVLPPPPSPSQPNALPPLPPLPSQPTNVEPPRLAKVIAEPLPKVIAESPSQPTALPPPPSPAPTPSALKPARPPSVSLEVGWKVAEATVPGPDAPAPFEAPPTQANAVSAPLLTDLAKAEVAHHEAAAQQAEEPVTAVGPAPAMAEIFRDATEGSPNGEVPANPFSEVSDGAIEYFVEWSLEQSIGPRATPQAKFSDVPMVLPGNTGAHTAFDDGEDDALARRKRLVMQAGVFAGGVALGALVVTLIMHRPAAPKAAPPVAAAAPGDPAPPPPVAAPAPAEAELAVSSRPAGATVIVDGEALGTTPLTAKVRAGKHEVVVQKDRYATQTESVDAPAQLRIELRRPSAILHVRSTPAAAEVTVAGEVRGRTPVDIKLPGYESYDVRVALAGARPWRKRVYLGRVSNNVEATLARAPAAKAPAAKAPPKR